MGQREANDDLEWVLDNGEPRWLWLGNHPGSSAQQFLFRDHSKFNY